MTRIAILLLASITITAASQQPAPAKPTLSPVGHWVEKSNPNNDLQLWWDFHADGTLIVTAGATARSVYKLTGLSPAPQTLTIGVSSPKEPAGIFDVHFVNGKLYTTPRAPKPPTLEFTRIGPQRFISSPLVGKWQISGAPHATDPKQEEIRARLIRTVTAYNSDGTYEARVPIDATQGTWSAALHSYTLQGYPPLPFEREGSTLTLSSPVGPKGKRTYVPDKFF